MNRIPFVAALLALSTFVSPTAESASFTYHGALQDRGMPAEGSYDIELTLYSTASGAKIIGGPLVLYGVSVHEGNFSTDADFGPLSSSFKQAYVGVKVRNAGTGEFNPLGNIEAVVDTNTSCPGSWSLDGNAGNSVGSYIGTADSQPLILKTGAVQSAITDMIGGGTVPRWIGGGSFNTSSGGQGAFIGGGGSNSDSTKKNYVGPFSVIGGGDANQAGIGAANGRAVVAGGNGNKANADYAVISGGQTNIASAEWGTVAGGFGNSALNSGIGSASTNASTVGGGYSNTATFGATVSGGQNNYAQGNLSAIAGGEHNLTYNYTDAVGGGEGNVAFGGFSVVPGGFNNIAGAQVSFAGGYGARVRIAGSAPSPLPAGVDPTDYSGTTDGDIGTFAWADSTTSAQGQFTTTGPNKFQVLATGGANFVTGRSGTTWTAGVQLASGGGSWSSTSDRNLKTGWQDIDPELILDEVIALPVTTWSYIAQGSNIRHIGPMAQDFYAAFQVGEDERHITQVDEGGVALAAIQGLNKKLEAENDVLREQVAALDARLNEIERRKGN